MPILKPSFTKIRASSTGEGVNDTALRETGGFDSGGNGGSGFQIMDDDAAVEVLGEDELADKDVSLRAALCLGLLFAIKIQADFANPCLRMPD